MPFYCGRHVYFMAMVNEEQIFASTHKRIQKNTSLPSYKGTILKSSCLTMHLKLFCSDHHTHPALFKTVKWTGRIIQAKKLPYCKAVEE